MHDRHDTDLIAAFADGDLEGDTSAIEQQLAECAECRVEFELHRDVRAVLSSAPSVTMTDDERSRLRAGVLAGVERGAPVVQMPVRRPSRRWMALGSVAAAALAVVGVAGIVTSGLGTGTDDSATATTAAATAAAADDAAGAEYSDRLQLAVPETTMMADDGDMAEESATATTAASAELAEPYLSYQDMGDAPEVEVDAMVERTIAGLAATDAPEPLTAEWFAENDKPTPSCFVAVEDPLYAVITATIGSEEVEVLIVRGEDAIYRPETFTVEGCVPR